MGAMRATRSIRTAALGAVLCAGCVSTRAVAVFPDPPRALPAPTERPPTAAAVEEALLRREGLDPARLRCNRENRWGGELRRDAEAAADDLLAALAPSLATAGTDGDAGRAALRKRIQNLVFWRMVRAVLLEGDNNNWGVLALRGRTYPDASGAPRQVLLYRSGFTPAPEGAESCFSSLLDDGGVKHVVNLFDGDIPAEDLVAAEARAAARRGAGYHTASDAADGPDGKDGYGPWRDLLRKSYEDADKRRQATLGVARLIREQMPAPRRKTAARQHPRALRRRHAPYRDDRRHHRALREPRIDRGRGGALPRARGLARRRPPGRSRRRQPPLHPRFRLRSPFADPRPALESTAIRRREA